MKGKTKKVFIENVVDQCNVYHNCSAQELRSPAAAHIAVHLFAVGANSLPNSKLVLAEKVQAIFVKHSTNGLTTHTFVMSNRSCIWVYQPQRSRYFLPGLNCAQLFVDQHQA
ncbi:hypothetical protein TNCV_2225461 [Trichonephila clavipes]|nr:hypothetical protein TNCV_2225461 [Trichonephila clavipes]